VTPDELMLEVSEAVNHAPVDLRHVMLNVAGRWTGIQAVTWEEESGTLFIESED
jgi:hypothetical protein